MRLFSATATDHWHVSPSTAFESDRIMSSTQRQINVSERSSEQLYNMSFLLKRMRRVRSSNPLFRPTTRAHTPELSKSPDSPSIEAEPFDDTTEEDGTPWISAQDSTVLKLANDDEELRALYDLRSKRLRPKRTSNERYRRQLAEYLIVPISLTVFLFFTIV